jgi:PAS domain S-box-containing protein
MTPAQTPSSEHVPKRPHSMWSRDPAAWLAAIVDSSDDAIVGKTLDSIIRSWNGGAARMFGYTAEEIIGKPVTDLMPPELRHEEAEIVARLSRGERIDHYETVRMKKDGTRIDVSLSVSPIRDASGTIIGAAKIARDITEAKRLRDAERQLSEQLQEQSVELEEQALELEQQVEEAQSLQEELEHTNDELHRVAESARDAQARAESANRAKSVFLATMSHELRTPLNAIAGYLDLLRLGLRGPVTDEQRVDLERIKRNQETLLRLIEDVLDFAKLESGRIEYRTADVPINEVLRTLETFVAPMLEKKRITYHFAPCDDGLVARADRDKVEQVMLNLLSNAAKFTDSGRIDVRCGTVDDQLKIDVIDTGRGIAADLLATIFEPFVQGEQELTRTADGTGLGLSISRQLARGMGGDVLVRSESGKGSTFTLLLPKAGGGS